MYQEISHPYPRLCPRKRGVQFPTVGPRSPGIYQCLGFGDVTAHSGTDPDDSIYPPQTNARRKLVWGRGGPQKPGKSRATYHRLQGAPFPTLIAAEDAPFWQSFPPLLQSALISPEIWVILSRDYLTKGAILETHGLPMISLEIRENNGQYIAVCGGAIANPNRG